MATQAEIDQVLGVWAANFLLANQKSFFNSSTNVAIDKWFKKYIQPLYKKIGTPSITLPSAASRVENCSQRDK
jgi:hypothetical protein